MTADNKTNPSRREFLKDTGRIAAASTLVAAATTHVHASEDNTIQIALVGCGGRGTGAAANALSVKNGPIKLVALADVFEDRMSDSVTSLQKRHPEVMANFDVPPERKFIGFEAYKQAMDCLKPGDVVILATPPAFRWVHFTYAIEKGLNVFMEKPVTVDGPTSQKMFALGEESVKRNLKVGVGLMCRHCEARGELFDRIQNGEIGDIIEMRAYRMAGPTASEAVGRCPEGQNELEYQIRNFHSFLWASGGCYSDFLIHNIDECCWMKDAWPIRAKAIGGRHYRGNKVDQNFDSYAVEYTFPDGTKLMLDGRTIAGCHNEFASYAHGSKGAAVISTAAHSPAKCRIYKGWNLDKENMVWAFRQPERSPYQLEWDHLIDAIRNDKPYNEVERGVEASLVTSMGRMAAHTGKLVTRDQVLNSGHEFAPDVNKLELGGVAPLASNDEGRYPVPMPGLIGLREYDPNFV